MKKTWILLSVTDTDNAPSLKITLSESTKLKKALVNSDYLTISWS